METEDCVSNSKHVRLSDAVFFTTYVIGFLDYLQVSHAIWKVPRCPGFFKLKFRSFGKSWKISLERPENFIV